MVKRTVDKKHALYISIISMNDNHNKEPMLGHKC